MKLTFPKTFLSLIALSLGSAATSQAAIYISEVDARGSSAGYATDWFELTNDGPAAVDITGWKMDDDSNLFSAAVSLRGVTSIAPGQSVVFFEGSAAGTTDAAGAANFKSAWFGSNVPAGFTIGAYDKSGVGLSSTGDGVTVFDSSGTSIARVSFNASPLNATFDNSAGVNNALISTPSVVGVNGAFTSATSNEVGSPGAVPEPGSVALIGLAGITLLFRRRR